MSDDFERRLDKASARLVEDAERARAADREEQDRRREQAAKINAAIDEWNKRIPAWTEHFVNRANQRVGGAGIHLDLYQEPPQMIELSGLTRGLPSIRIIAERGEREASLIIRIDENGMVAVTGPTGAEPSIEPSDFDKPKIEGAIADLVERLVA